MRERIGDNWCESATICSKRPIRRQPGDGGAISPFRIVRWRGRTAGLPSNGATNRRSDAMWAMLTAAKEPRSIAHQREARGDALSAMIGILTLATLRLLLHTTTTTTTAAGDQDWKAVPSFVRFDRPGASCHQTRPPRYGFAFLGSTGGLGVGRLVPQSRATLGLAARPIVLL
jgi:hypothetical protein